MVLFQLTSPKTVLPLISGSDALILRQDAVYLARTPEMLPSCQCYMLAQDAADRQISCPPTIHLLDDTQWVALTLQATTVMSC